MKFRFSLGVVLSLFTIIFISCKENLIDEQQQTSDQLTISLAKSAYSKSHQNARLSASESRFGQPNWEKAKELKYSNGETYIQVALDHPITKITLSSPDSSSSSKKKSFQFAIPPRQLIYYKDKDGNNHFRVMETIPEKGLNIGYGDVLSGEVSYYDLETGRLLDGHVYQDGKIVKYFKTEIGRDPVTSKNARGYVYKMLTKCYYSGNSQNDPAAWNAVYGYVDVREGMHNCVTPLRRESGYGQILYNLNFSDLVYEATWVNDGTGTTPGDGSPGGLGPTAGQGWYIVLAGREYRVESGTRECMAALLQQMNSVANVVSTVQAVNGYSNSPQVNNMINQLSTQQGWRVSIKEAVLPQESNPFTGETWTPNASTRGVGGVIEVTFDSRYLDQASDLAIMRTLIHESVHAYFEFMMHNPINSGYPTFVQNNDLLYDRKGDPQADQNVAQHEQMAAKYVDDIAGMLVFWCNSQTPTIVSPIPGVSLLDYCKDMAWGGLVGTKAYRKYATNKTRIQETMLNEQNRSSRSTYQKTCMD